MIRRGGESAGAALAVWIVAPGASVTAWLAYAFVPLGFAFRWAFAWLALGILRPDVIVPSGALHAWTVGAIGLMTLAVMARASLGQAANW